MARGFLYLVAVMDRHNRYLVAWRLSNTLDAGFCTEALTEALVRGKPEVFNTDQGSQFSSREFTQVLQDRGVKIRVDGKGRYARQHLRGAAVAYGEVRRGLSESLCQCRRRHRRELGAYFRFYNNQRPHQALSYRTPAEVFHGDPTVREEESKYRRCSDGPVSGSYTGVTGPSLNSALMLSN